MHRPWLLAATAAVLLVSLAADPASADPAWLLVTGVVLLLLELTAPHVSGVGFLSLAGAGYLGLASLPQTGAAFAAWLALGCLSLRSLWRGSRQPQVSWDEALHDGFPAALALASTVLLPGDFDPAWRLLLALFVYAGALLAMVTLVSGPGSSRARSVRLTQVLLVAAASGAVVAFPQAPVAAVALLPLVVLPYLLAPRLSMAHHAAHLVQRERALSQRSLDSIQERLELLRQDKQSSFLECELFRRFAGTFARAPDLPSTAGLITREAGALVAAHQVALFSLQGDELEPIAYHGPAEERLANRTLLALREPLLEECLAQGRPLWKTPGPATGKELFPADEHGLALPLEGRGVLYLGWRAPPSLSSDTLRSLLALVELGSIAISTAAGLEQVQQALEYHSSQHSDARAWLERFDVLLAGVRALAGPLSSDRVLDSLREMAVRLVEHERGAVVVRLGGRPRLLGWPPDPAPELPAVEQFATFVTEGGRPLVLDDIRASRFQPVWLQGSAYLAVPIMADGAGLGAIVLMRDSIGFDRREEESLSLAAVQTAIMLDKCRLHEEVVESKARLEQSQTQLVQSSKLAAVGQLAAGVAHELNTPLGALLLRVESARRSLDKGEHQAVDKKLQVARQAALSARDIVSKLLAYSREDEQEKTPCDLAEVVQSALTLVESQLTHHQVKVHCQLDSSALVLGRANQLGQVVINLLLNARDAITSSSSAGEVHLRTRLEPDEVQLEIEDSGPGIAREVRDRLFDPFFTTKPVGSGTGLGLWVSHQIIEAHGGHLSVAPDAPTRFCISLPRL